MKANIERGSGFRGTLNYVLDEGIKKTGNKKAEIVGGNMVGKTAKELAAEFGATRKLRPEIKKPVWHCSLSLPKNEKLDSKKWDEIGKSFLEKMKLDPEKYQYTMVRHSDTDLDHVHIIATRISLDGEIWQGKFELFNAIEATQKLEKEHNLKISAGLFELDENGNSVKKSRDKKNITFGEVQQSARTGEVPARIALQNILDLALNEEQSIFSFIEKIESAGAIALPNVAKTGRMNGFSFNFNGISFKGSDLGKEYSWKNIKQKGVIYEQDGESKKLIEKAKRIKQEINKIDKRESAGMATGIAATSGRNQQNINSNESIESRKSGNSKISNEEYSDSSKNGLESSRKLDKSSGFSNNKTAKIDTTSTSRNKSFKENNQKTELENMGNNTSNRGNSWNDVAYNIVELTAPIDRAADSKVKFEAWKQQHNSLRSPNYRITLISRNGAKPYNIGKTKDGEIFFTAQEVANKIPEFRRKNAQGRDIYITPIDEKNHYIVVDDLTPETKKAFDESGYKPCLVQESSKDNQQAIIKIKKHDGINEQKFANEVVRKINLKYGDPKFSGVIHPFRMAGFSNKKEGRNNAFTVIVSAVHQICEKTEHLLNLVKLKYEKNQVESKVKVRIENINNESLTGSVTSALSAFRRHFKKVLGLANAKKWIVDYSRIDFQVCKDMFKDRFSKNDIYTALIEASPSISERKNNVEDYANRTVNKAEIEYKSKINKGNKLEK